MCNFIWTYFMVLLLPTQCLCALCYWTTMCTTQDKFSLGFYRKQMVGYYVDNTVSHWWLFQSAHSASLLFSSSTETQNIKHNRPFLACKNVIGTLNSLISLLFSFHFLLSSFSISISLLILFSSSETTNAQQILWMLCSLNLQRLSFDSREIILYSYLHFLYEHALSFR